MEIAIDENYGPDHPIEQRRQLAHLEDVSRKCAVLAEEAFALRECLQATGVLSADAFRASLHRRRFMQVMERHPCICCSSLDVMMQTRDLTLMMAKHADLSSIQAITVASKAMRRGISNISAEIGLLFPPMLYAVGGEGVDGRALTSGERFNPTRGIWEPIAPLKSARTCCAAVAFAGNVYVVGGRGADGNALNMVECYHPSLDIWETMPRMSVARGEVAAVGVNGRLCALGGRDDPFVLDTAEALDLKACFSKGIVIGSFAEENPSPRSSPRNSPRSASVENQSSGWCALPAMQTERQAAGATVLGGHVYAIGGLDVGAVVLSEVERLCPGDDSWQQLPPLRTPRACLAAEVVGGAVYVIGGYDSNFREIVSLERFDPLTMEWTASVPMQIPKWGLGSVSTCNSVYILGGTAFGGLVVDTVDFLNVESSLWESSPNLQIARRCFGVAACR